MFIMGGLVKSARPEAGAVRSRDWKYTMTLRLRSRIILLAAGAGLLAGACAPIRQHRGYLADETLVSAIQPGVDNRESVATTLGRPTFTGQFDDRDWYYVSRTTKQRAFGMPEPETQRVLHVRFDEAGNVAAVERTGLELVASIDPAEKVTPTLGRDRSFFDELFGNIGAVGSAMGQQTGTPDNPQ